MTGGLAFGALLGDKAFDVNWIRADLAARGATAVIPPKPRFPMWHLSAKLGVARNRSKDKSDGFCHHDHARHHEIESQWEMVAFDIADGAVFRTYRSCRLHA